MLHRRRAKERNKQFGGYRERKRKRVHVETIDEEQLKFAWPERREETNRHNQAKQHMFR